jgi:hypothetical protein
MVSRHVRGMCEGRRPAWAAAAEAELRRREAAEDAQLEAAQERLVEALADWSGRGRAPPSCSTASSRPTASADASSRRPRPDPRDPRTSASAGRSSSRRRPSRSPSPIAAPPAQSPRLPRSVATAILERSAPNVLVHPAERGAERDEALHLRGGLG